MKKWLSIVLLFALLNPAALAFETRDALREAYRALSADQNAAPYVKQPSAVSPYDPGELSAAAADSALAYLNFLRSLADLGPVERSPIYDFQCQRGAVLLAALDYVEHDAPQPDDMDRDFYESAHLATLSSNIAKFNWMRPTILREGVAYFVRDDGDANLPVLGHRRWLLNPYMNATGFGLANSETGMSYVAMYAHDQGRPDVQWSEIPWPTEGVFPVELMHSHLAWSVTLNPEIYSAEASRIQAVLEEETLGLRFEFNCSEGTGDGFCTVSMENYGSGPCVIFRPDLEKANFTDYLQNQKWTVRLSGLVLRSGGETEYEYEVDMTSLYVQEVANIEISHLEAELKPGDSLLLTADVIPSYADDLSVGWSTSNPFVATVNDFGTVTAVAEGECEITAKSANGRSDRCQVKVAESPSSN